MRYLKNGKSGNGAQGENVDVAICKQFCTEPDCNKDHVDPDLPGEGDRIRCFSCSATKDHLGNYLGNAHPSCWSESPDASLLVECEVGSICVTDLLVDWHPRGDQTASLVRRCANPEYHPNVDFCTEEQNGQNYMKDCSVVCQTSACNSGLEEVYNRHDSGKDLSCYSCQYGYDYVGNILTGSNEKCALPTVNDRIDAIQCPPYMNQACFTAATWDYSNGQVAEQDFKGCSAFSLETNSCSKVEIGGASQDTCKETCDTNSCNNVTPKRGISCHTCQVTFNSLNQTLGVGDPNCFSNPSEDTIQNCPQGQQYCTTELIVDWKVRGHQQYNVRRGCSFEPERPCFEGAASHGQAYFKDCTVTCDSDNCNDGLEEVAAKFDSGKGQEQCLTCSYLENSDGTVEGNAQCKDGTTSKFSKNCPTYANSGCYTGSSLHYEADDSSLALEEVYKGCSTFEPKEHSDCKVIENIIGDGNLFYDVGVCKEYCEEPDCNIDHVTPELPGLGGMSCYTCSITMDHVGNIIGQGDSSCMTNEPNPNLLTKCENQDDVCATHMYIDWLARGGQAVIVDRRCISKDLAPSNLESPACLEEKNGNHQARDCSSFCSGPGCNKNIDDVIDQHDAGNDGLTCFSCQYGFDYSGNLLPNSNVDCKLPSVSGSITAIQCPRYMNAACFTAATWDYSGDKVAEEDYKGCSGFRLDNGEEYCDQFEVNGKKLKFQLSGKWLWKNLISRNNH